MGPHSVASWVSWLLHDAPPPANNHKPLPVKHCLSLTPTYVQPLGQTAMSL
jgi:hypothetical protein